MVLCRFPITCCIWYIIKCNVLSTIWVSRIDYELFLFINRYRSDEFMVNRSHHQNGWKVCTLEDELRKIAENICEFFVIKPATQLHVFKENSFSKLIIFLTKIYLSYIIQHSSAGRTPMAAIQLAFRNLYMFHILMKQCFNCCGSGCACVCSVERTVVSKFSDGLAS